MATLVDITGELLPLGAVWLYAASVHADANPRAATEPSLRRRHAIHLV